MGTLFDTTALNRYALRPVADSSVGWSSKWTRRFGDEWARLFKLKEDSSVPPPDAALQPELSPRPPTPGCEPRAALGVQLSQTMPVTR